MPLFPPSMHHCVLQIQVSMPRVFVGGDGNICIWESSPLDKYRGVGETLALDFPGPRTMLWISCSQTTLWRARAETCQAVTFSGNTSSDGDCFEVKTTNMRPGQNRKYNLSLHGTHNFQILGLHVALKAKSKVSPIQWPAPPFFHSQWEWPLWHVWWYPHIKSFVHLLINKSLVMLSP